MTLQTLTWIIIWFFILLFIAGIVIVTFLFGRSSAKDLPGEAAVFVKTGIHISKPYKAKLFGVGQAGLGFFYGNKKVVFKPTEYKEYFYQNRRAIYVNHAGQLIASPFTDDVELSNNEKEDLIYEMCASHVGADGMRAIKNKDAKSIIVVALAAFIIGMAAVIGFNAFQEQMAKRQANVPQQQTEQPVEVK